MPEGAAYLYVVLWEYDGTECLVRCVCVGGWVFVCVWVCVRMEVWNVRRYLLLLNGDARIHAKFRDHLRTQHPNTHTHTHTHTRHTYAHTHARTHAHASGSSHCTSASLSLVRAQPPPTPSHPLSSGKACEISVLVVSLPCSLRRCLSLSLAHSLYPMHPHPHANSLPLLVCSHPYPSPLPRSRTVLIRCGSPAQYSSLASVPPLVAPASGG